MGTTYGNSPSPTVIITGQIVTVNSNTTLTGVSYNKTFKVTGAYTLTLPTAISGTVTSLIIVTNDTSASNVTVATQGTDFIRAAGGNQTTITLGPGDSATFETTGSGFLLVNVDPLKANLISPALTGTPTVPTAAVNTNTTQAASTAFVLGQAATTTPAQAGTAQAGSATTFSRADHVHPSSAATPAAGDNSTAVATTAFVANSVNTILPITASVASNALTVTLNPTTLQFRSTTLGSGAVTTVSVPSPISVTAPVGATLGTVSGQQSRVYVVAINNAGTVELAVVGNIWTAGIDEAGLATTAAINGSSTVTSVMYSTAARTGVAYRIVGYVDSTQATAGTWATAPSMVQGAGGNALTGMNSLGYGQTWQSQAIVSSTTYYNTTGKSIYAFFHSDITGQANLTVTIGAYTFPTIYVGVANNSNCASQSVIIPPGHSYSATTSSGTLGLSVLK